MTGHLPLLGGVAALVFILALPVVAVLWDSIRGCFADDPVREAERILRDAEAGTGYGIADEGGWVS